MKLLFDDSLIDSIADKLVEFQKRKNSDLPLLKQQLCETEKSIENMLNAIQQGIFTTSTKKRLEELEERKSKLEISVLQNQMQQPTFSKQQIIYWLHKFRKMNISNIYQRKLLLVTAATVWLRGVYCGKVRRSHLSAAFGGTSPHGEALVCAK